MTFLLAFGALFSIVNPLSGAFIFFGATRELEPRVRAQPPGLLPADRAADHRPGDDLGGDIARRQTTEWLGRQRACKS